MEVDTKSPLHPIVQVTDTPTSKKLIEVDSSKAHIKVFFVGYKERKAALRGKLFSPPWLHLELWRNSSGADFNYWIGSAFRTDTIFLRHGRTLATQMLPQVAR